MHAIRQQESSEECEHRLNVPSTRKPEDEQRVLVVCKQSDYHRGTASAEETRCENDHYQDKDEVLGMSLES